MSIAETSNDFVGAPAGHGPTAATSWASTVPNPDRSENEAISAPVTANPRMRRARSV